MEVFERACNSWAVCRNCRPCRDPAAFRLRAHRMVLTPDSNGGLKRPVLRAAVTTALGAISAMCGGSGVSSFCNQCFERTSRSRFYDRNGCRGCRQGCHRRQVREARPSRVGVAIAERQCSASIDGKYHLIESRVIWKSFLRTPCDDGQRIR